MLTSTNRDIPHIGHNRHNRHNQGHRHDRGHRDNRDSRGTVLLLFPAAVLVMIVLGALVIDVGVTNLRGRELGAVADSAANDALAALDIEALRRGDGIMIDPLRAREIVAEAVAAGPLPHARVTDLEVGTDPTGRIEIAVTLQVDVDLVLVPAIGDLDRITLTRTGRVVILEE